MGCTYTPGEVSAWPLLCTGAQGSSQRSQGLGVRQHCLARQRVAPELADLLQGFAQDTCETAAGIRA